MEIPNSVTSLGDAAFSGCSNLESFTGKFASEDHRCLIVEGVLKAFAPARLTSYTIPNSVTEIGVSTFFDCNRLISIEIPNSVTKIANSAISACSVRSVEIPNSVTEIGNGAIHGCPDLESFTGKFASEDHRCLIVDGVLNSFAPAGLTSYSIPNTVTEIGDYAFSGCYRLTSVEIPNPVTVIGRGAFSSCHGLTSVGISNSVTEIREYAFSNCVSLTSFTIPTSVTSIGENAFNICTSLTEITSLNTTPPTIDSSIFTDVPTSTCILKVPAGVVEDYRAADGWSEFTNIEGIKQVEDVEEEGLNLNITLDAELKVTINAGTETDNNGAITIPSTITFEGTVYTVVEIAENAFSNCINLITVELPKTIKTIGQYAFQGCTNLKSIFISGQRGSLRATSTEDPTVSILIGQGAFAGCTGLREIISLSTTPPTIKSDTFDGVSKTECVVRVPKEAVNAYKAAAGWSDFTNIEAIEEIEIVDAQVYDRSTSTYAYITYRRNFIVDSWQVLYVPFSLNYDDWKDVADVAELACVHIYQDNRTTIEFVTVTEGSTLPNVPYVIKPKATGEISLDLSCRELKAAPAEHTNYISCSSPRYIFKLYGNYQTVTKADLGTYGEDGAYIMAKNNRFTKSSTNLGPQRFFIEKEKNPNGYWPDMRSAGEEDEILLMVDGEVVSNITTSIEVIQKDETMEGDCYNLWGQKVGPDYKGIVIINGKKYLRK